MVMQFNEEQSIKAAADLLEKLVSVNFCFVGSYNLFLQGIEIVPHDIDLLTDDEGIDKISFIYDAPVKKEEGREYKEVEFFVDGIKIHVVSNQGSILLPESFDNEVILVEKNKLKIPCISLSAELLFYKKCNREKDKQKVELIEKFLKK